MTRSVFGRQAAWTGGGTYVQAASSRSTNITMQFDAESDVLSLSLTHLVQISVGSFTFTISPGANARIVEQIGDMCVLIATATCRSIDSVSMSPLPIP